MQTDPKEHFRIPAYAPPRNAWRQLIHAAARTAARRAAVVYCASDRLAVNVALCFAGTAVELHDVDNRLKDILDALQGRMGGPKSVPPHAPLIPNDRQIYRVSVTTLSPPKQSRGAGHATITRFRTRRIPSARSA